MIKAWKIYRGKVEEFKVGLCQELTVSACISLPLDLFHGINYYRRYNTE
jgi:hypothetical protein